MPKFIHDRAEHILAKNPAMSKGTAFAIATQQSHSLGKSPKGYGTSEGKREAKDKYPTPKDDKKTANPGKLESPKMAEDKIQGGLADKKKPSDFSSQQVSMGVSHEKEHTNSPTLAREIAMDHLTEDPRYYTKLEKIEKTAYDSFGDELDKILKEGGVVDSLKQLALTDIPGTKPWLLGNARKATQFGKASTGVSGVRPRVRPESTRVAPGVYDVSGLAAKMGL